MTVPVRIASVALVLVAALVQVSIVYRIELGAVSPDVLILVVSAIALLTGSISGAVHGFLAGVAIALFAALPLGPHALLATLVGYTIGRVGEALVTDDHPVPPLVAGVLATFTMQIGRPVVEFLVNENANRVDALWTHALLVTVISSVLALPVYVLVRRVLLFARDLGGDAAGNEAAA